jgi:hypothetical protein
MGMTIVTEFDSAKERLKDPYADATERQWSTFTHLTGIAAAVGPLLLTALPIVLWLIKKDESPYIDDHGKEATNFQLSMLLYVVVFGLLTCGLAVAFFVVLNVVCSTIAAVAANKGEFYRYPMCIRFLS